MIIKDKPFIYHYHGASMCFVPLQTGSLPLYSSYVILMSVNHWYLSYNFSTCCVDVRMSGPSRLARKFRCPPPFFFFFWLFRGWLRLTKFRPQACDIVSSVSEPWSWNVLFYGVPYRSNMRKPRVCIFHLSQMSWVCLNDRGRGESVKKNIRNVVLEDRNPSLTWTMGGQAFFKRGRIFLFLWYSLTSLIRMGVSCDRPGRD